MKLSIYDLAFSYKDQFNSNKTGREIVMELACLLDQDWIVEEIQYHLSDINQEPESLLSFFQHKRKQRHNLLSPRETYFHQELRIMPGLPVLEVNIDNGKIEQRMEEYYNEPRASYTIDDLMAYYYKKMHLEQKSWHTNKYRGALKWLLEHFTLDHVLFTIDVVSNMVLSGAIRPPDTPVILSDYEREGMGIMQNSISEVALEGGFRIVLRKRIPMDRRRSQDTGHFSAVPYDDYRSGGGISPAIQ